MYMRLEKPKKIDKQNGGVNEDNLKNREREKMDVSVT
jgi:hypothetical protein